MQKEKRHPFRYTIQYLNSLIWIFAFILFISSIAMAQWDKQSPVPTHLDIRGTGAPTAQRVFIATDDNFFDNGGALFESNDGGATWLQRDVPLSLGESFNGLFFLDSQNGWAFGNDNYKTTDGGTTWNQLQFLGSTYFMKFYTTNFGLAAGNFGQMVSIDGGASWEPSPHEMFSFDFADALIGIGVSDSGLFRTSDGGVTFVSVHSDSSKAVAFLSTNVAVAIAGNLYIRSTDGGLTWTPGSAVSDRNRLFPISGDIVLSWNKLAAFPSGDGNVSRSTDGGQTWTDLGVVIPEGIHSLTLSDAQTVIASDVKGNMFRSSNAGLTWVQTFTSPGPMPGFLGSTEPAFANAQTGYYGYGSGFVIKTTDGGTTWFQISSGTHQTLNDIDRFANGNLIAVGDNGIILTSNGTLPWLHQEILTAEDISAVQVLNANEAVVLDAEGQVYTSTDGGATWNASGIKSPIGNAKDFHFNNLLDGWVTGADFDTSSLYHTTNGGNSWTPVEDIIGTYVAMDFEGTNGWTLNTGGSFYRTTDNGVTWTQKELPGFPSVVSDIDFFNADTGYAVGWEGYAARSIDGGNTWEILQVPEIADKFTSIYVTSANEFWVSTNDDAAYYSANGGLNWAVLEIGSSGFGSFSAIAASPEGDAWAAGYQGFIEHFTGPPPPPLNQPPHASFNYLASGLTLQFTDTSIDPDGSIIGWEWDFGDSTFSTEQNPLHTFPEADTYIIRLTVTDNDSSTGSGIRIIAVQPGPGGVFGNFTEVTPLDSVFVTPDDEDFWVITTAPADYDSDGDLDIAVLGYYVIYNVSVEERLLLLRNNGPAGLTQWDFTYINVPLDGLSTGASDLAWGDADGDGDLDLAVGTDLNTVIYRNDDSTLIMSDTELPGYLEDNDQADFDLRSITWADFDNDGDLDLLLPSVYEDSTFSYKTSLMRNDGPNGTGGFIFTEMDSVFAPTIHAQSAWADYDGDQDLDLLLINMAPLTEDGFIRRYRNDGNGVFTGENILDSLTIEHGEAQWGDYDGDGDLDILVAGHIKELNGSFTQTLRIYQNSSEVYVPVEVIDCIPCEEWVDLTAATWADYDSDGDMDILLAGSYNSGSQIEGRAKIYINTNGIFTESDNELPAPRASGDRGGTFSWLDVDGDGDLDYFIAGQYFVPGGNGLVEAQMHIYRNDVPVQNNAPSTPGGLNAAVQADKNVVLTWTPASDDHTPAAALTYDLELYRDNVPVNMTRRLPEPGSVSAVTEWQLSGLQDGHYKWTLRAVDAAYIGSPAVTGSFSVGVTGISDNNLPIVYALENNYPNPFNPVTSIKYSIPHEGLVTLKIYSITGEEVATLINEVKQPGNYEVTFDAKNLSSQIYFYRIQAGNFVQTKKMILLK